MPPYCLSPSTCIGYVPYPMEITSIFFQTMYQKINKVEQIHEEVNFIIYLKMNGVDLKFDKVK
jgi:hypothetical protein